jgi:hypothetical protein
VRKGLDVRLDRCIWRDRAMGTGLADELTAKAPQMEANIAALEEHEAARAVDGHVDAAEVAHRHREADGFCQTIEAIGIMVMRVGGLEPDPARSRELMQQWFDLGSVQECLEEIRARWAALIEQTAADARAEPVAAAGHLS